MKIARQVKKQIESHYEYNGAVYIQYDDLIAHLKGDMIDNNQKPDHGHNGYDESFDGSMIALHYKDGSILVVACSGGGMTASG